MAKLDAFTRAYIETALWSTTGDDDQPLDKNYSANDIAPETMEKMIADCTDFQTQFADLLSASGLDDDKAGHYFWLSREGHGSGYFDEDLDALQEAAKSYGNFDLYVGDDGLIYGSGGRRQVGEMTMRQDDRDHRMVTLYDDDAMQMMQGWWSSQNDPLYAIHSMGGQHEAWVFQDAIANLESDIAKVKKIGKDKFQLGKGTFTKKEIDELHIIRDALVVALDAEEGTAGEARETRHLPRLPQRTRIVTRHVADFNTLSDLIAHAQQEGATHVFRGPHESATWLYFPMGDGRYAEARIFQKRGYFHVPAPGDRTIVEQLPAGAEPVAGAESMVGVEPIKSHPDQPVEHLATESRHHTVRDQFVVVGVDDNNIIRKSQHFPTKASAVEFVQKKNNEVVNWGSPTLQYEILPSGEMNEHIVRDYIAVDKHGRHVGGPFKNYDTAKRSADEAGGYVQFAMNEAGRRKRNPSSRGRRVPMTVDAVMSLAGDLAKKTNGGTPKHIGSYRWSSRNQSAQFTTYSPEHSQKVVVVVSIFEDGSTALNFFSDEGLSGTDTYENVGHFDYNGADIPEMVKDIKWVWETVDGYAESWGAGQDEMDEAARGGSRPWFGEAERWGYAIKIDGVESDFPTLPLGRQGDSYRAVQQFKATAKHDWISTKARDGRRSLTEVKRWIKAVQPDQFYARWPTDVNDDSVQIWYTGGQFETGAQRGGTTTEASLPVLPGAPRALLPPRRTPQPPRARRRTRR